MEQAEYALMDTAEQRMWWYRALHERLIDALAGVTGVLLDGGCGTGGFLTVLARRRPDLAAVGVEYASAAARRSAAKSGAPVACGSVNQLPFKSGSVDAVVLADVLCHEAVDPPVALAEAMRVLKRSGRLVVNMPAYAWLMSAHDARVHNTRRQTASQTRAMLRAAGFERVRACYWNGLLLPLMIVQRKLLAVGDAASDVAPFPPWLDAMFHGMTRLEHGLPFALPAGGSVLAVAEKP
jgi:SAM-dependent methyltransferase